nr:class I SAM-dependent methyltransferase family protein [Pseudomonas chlororaphis]
MQARLVEVSQQVADAINALESPRVQILSLCAGDGRDLLKVLLSGHTSKAVDATLIELDQVLVEQGRKAFAEHGLGDIVRFRCADATLFSSYRDLPKAELVMVCGVFGNVRGDHVERLIFSLKGFCRPDARVVWTRSLNEFDDGEAAADWIRRCFALAGFRESAFKRTSEGTFGVGSFIYEGEQECLPSTGQIFEFSAFWDAH